MIAMALILALSTAFILGLAKYWRDIVQWIKKAANKVAEVLGVVVEGTRTFVAKVSNGFRNKSKYYFKDKVTHEWQEVVYTKEVFENEIPPDILAKVRRQKTDIDIPTTEELKLAISA